MSDGDTGKHDLLGTDDPSEEPGVRIFFTQQHGLNKTYEIVVPARQAHDHDGQDGRDGLTGPARASARPGPAP